MTVPSPSNLPVQLLQRLCTTAEMRLWDANAIEKLAIPGLQLMENAAEAVVSRIGDLAADSDVREPFIVCCGAGNNGGDGYAVARLLKQQGREVVAIRLGGAGGPKATASGPDAKANRDAWEVMGETVDFPSQSEEARQWLQRAGLVVDAVFGTGLNRAVSGEAAALFEAVNHAAAPFKVAVDVPSGIHSDSGMVMGSAIRCTHTVALQVAKTGCFQYPGAGHAGEVEVADISIPVQWAPSEAATYLLDQPFAGGLLPSRPADGHKGTFGHLLTICGSAGMGGAALLSGAAGLRTGTGLVTVGVPRCLRDGFLAAAPELMTLSCEEGGANAFEPVQTGFYLDAAATRDAVVLGCGLGGEATTREFVRHLTQTLKGPLLIDADGLNALDAEALKARSGPTVITPHPGELTRLGGVAKEALAGDRIGHARRLAREWGVVLVLKGAATVVAAPGGDCFINPTGDQGLATAGTGDVLAGIIGGLLAQGMAPLGAALAGVYLHGLARDCLREQYDEAYFSAGDLIGGINPALKLLREG